MGQYAEMLQNVLNYGIECIKATSIPVALLIIFTSVVSTFIFVYAVLFFLAPVPRPPIPSEKTYITSDPSGQATSPRPLPCWYDAWLEQRKAADAIGNSAEKNSGTIDEPEIEMSVVVPAYNEEKRLEQMLEEAVAFLDAEYGRVPQIKESPVGLQKQGLGGYEILVVNDGSRDTTVDIALAFARKHRLHDVLRICTLKENRGKGGAVTHGLRHVRGAYAVFADADGASRFSDLSKLVVACTHIADPSGRAISVGSRAHLVGSEAVVKRQRSALRNVLMHSFHLLLRLLTPPATARIRDTQCGFKLFTRPALPHIVPYMHAEGWIFDVEMLMLAESAPPAFVGVGEDSQAGIKVKEVHIDWREIDGSKLNVLWDSLGMAYGLALLRAGWIMGVYRRR